jgi:hypothetical protein
MDSTAINQFPKDDSHTGTTHKLQIKKSVPYVPNITSPRGVRPLLKHTQSRIKHTNSPIPSARSKTRWIGVPVRPLAWQPHFFSLARRSALNVEEKKRGRMPMAGFTFSAATPWMRRMINAGKNVARDRARSAWGVDFVKIVKLSMVRDGDAGNLR